MLIGKVEEVKKKGRVIKEINGSEWLVVFYNGKFYCFKNECTHEALPLEDSDIEDNKIVCPWHGACFDIETGKALCLPAVEDLEVKQVLEENGNLYIVF